MLMYTGRIYTYLLHRVKKLTQSEKKTLTCTKERKDMKSGDLGSLET
jgi:hypothetical protein